MTRRGCGCCGCREFDKRWCGIADATEAAAAGVTLTGSEYSIDFDLPDYDWAVLVTFPEIRERDDYYSGGYCGDGTEWGSGEFRHIIRVTNQADVVLLKLQLTISKDVAGVDDHVLIEVLETTNNFDAVLLRNYSLTSDKNGGRYIPSMRLTRREGITSIEFGGAYLLVDATPDGESFDSLTQSAALYATTEGTAGDTMRVSFESSWISGDYADPTGDWIVTGFEVANIGDALNVDCPDPRICAVNDSTYSTPQWENDEATLDISTLPGSTEDWRRLWYGCVGVYTQDELHINQAVFANGPLPSQVDQKFGYYYCNFDDLDSFTVRYNYDGDGDLTSIDDLTNAWTPFDAMEQSFSIAYSPVITSVVSSSSTSGKRKVTVQMSLPLLNKLAAMDIEKISLLAGSNTPVQNWVAPSTRGYDPAFLTQIGATYNDLISFDGHQSYWHIYQEDPSNPGHYVFYKLNFFGVKTGTILRAPDGLTESVLGAPHSSGTSWDPVYLVYELPRPKTNDSILVLFEKEVDEWDGEPPEITFTMSDAIYLYRALTNSDDRVFDVPVSATQSYDGADAMTVRYRSTVTGTQKTYTHSVYRFSSSFSHVTVDFNDLVLKLSPTTGPMPQPIDL